MGEDCRGNCRLTEQQGTAACKKVLKKEAACLEKNGEELQVHAVADCGLENEMVMRGLEEWPEKLPYLTIVIVKVRKI